MTNSTIQIAAPARSPPPYALIKPDGSVWINWEIAREAAATGDALAKCLIAVKENTYKELNEPVSQEAGHG